MLCAFAACKKESSSPPYQTIPGTVVGRWIVTEQDVCYETNGRYGPTYKTQYNDPNNYLQYNADGSVTWDSGGSINFPATIYTYTINGNIISLYGSIYNTFMEADTIKQLTANSLWLRQQERAQPGVSNTLLDKYYRN